jgi:WbqC-like protein family
MTPRTDVLVAQQPAYLPWPGFFSRLLDVSRLVLLDHVQYTSGGWQNRNFVRGRDGRKVRLTVPVRHRFGQAIGQVRIAEERWRACHWRTLTQCYSRASYWARWEHRLHEVYARPWERLADLNQALIRLLLDALELKVEVVPSSDLAPTGAKTAMLIDLCRRTQAQVLRVGAGAADGYLAPELLDDAGIAVEVATYSHPPYDQGPGPFTPGLSVLDLVLRFGPQARNVLANGAHLRPWRPDRAVTS